MSWEDHLTNLKARMHWLLALNFSGTEYYFSEDNVGDVYSTTNDRYLKFRAGLQIYRYPTLAIDLASRTSSITTASIGIAGKYAIHTIRDVTPLTNGEGTLSLWVEGADYDDRLDVMVGNVRTPAWGEEEIPFRFDLVDSRYEKDRVFPPNHVSAGDFANASDRAIGQCYPICYGHVYSVPIYEIDTTQNYYIISGHDVDSANATLHVNGSLGTGDAGEAEPVSEQTGYTRVDGDGLGAGAPAESDLVVADFDGMEDASGNLIENPAEITEHLVTNYSGLSSSEIGDFENAKAKMAAYKASCIFNGTGAASSTVFETIQRRLCGQFPLIPRWYLGQYTGVYVDVVNAPISGKLRLNRNLIKRAGEVAESSTDGLLNKIEIVYQYDAYLGKFRAYKVIDNSNNQRCKVSYNKYGLRQWQQRVVEFVDVQEEATIDQIVNWVTHAYSEIAMQVQYTATRDVLRYKPGQFIQVTDSNMGWSDKTFLIESITPDILETTIGLREHV